MTVIRVLAQTREEEKSCASLFKNVIPSRHKYRITYVEMVDEKDTIQTSFGVWKWSVLLQSTETFNMQYFKWNDQHVKYCMIASSFKMLPLQLTK